MATDQTTLKLTGPSQESSKGKFDIIHVDKNFVRRFYPSKVKNIVQSVIEGMLSEKDYDHGAAKHWAEQIVDTIRQNVKNECHIPNYKVVVQCVIGQVTGQGVRVASKCLWDDANDNYSSYTYQNESLFCTGIVFGIYYE